MDIEAFALTRPKAPEMITLDPSDVEAHGGASIKDTETKPFQVIMGSYLQQAKGDVIRLYLNDEFIDDETVIDEQATTSIFVRPGMFQKGLNRLKFHIERTSGNNEFTPELILLHRTSSPGGTPPALTLSVSHNSIGPGDANNVSVTVTYKNTQWYDRIFVDCNGARVQHQLLPDSTTPLPAAPKNVVIPIPRAALEQGGNDQNFEFKFRVVDYLTNPSGPPTWSDSVSVDVHLDRLSLPMAVLREILSDNNDDPATVDLEKMNGGPLWAQVHLAETVWKSGDSIHLTFTAERAGAVVGTYEQTFENREPGTNLTWEIPNAKVIADSTVKVVYELIRNGNVIATSDAAVAAVTGAGSTKLPPPFLVPPAQSPIDVLAYPDGVKMRIDYPGAQEGDRARLVELNAPAGTPQFPLQVFNSNKRVNVSLSASYLAERHGKTCEYQWNLNRGGGQAGKSPAVKVSVGRIVDGDERLPMPNVPQAPDNKTLDLNDFTGDAEVTLRPWLGISTSQFLDLRCVGTGTSGLPYIVTLLTHWQITANNITSGFTEKLLRNVLSDFKNNETIRIIAEIYRSSSAETPFILLPTLSLTLITTSYEIIINFDSEPSQPIPSMGRIHLEHATITNVFSERPHTKISPTRTFSETPIKNIGGQGLYLSDFTLVRVDFRDTYSYVSFYQAGYFDGWAKFYDQKGVMLEEVKFHRTYEIASLIECRGFGIASVEIYTTDGRSFFDNFRCIR